MTSRGSIAFNELSASASVNPVRRKSAIVTVNATVDLADVGSLPTRVNASSHASPHTSPIPSPTARRRIPLLVVTPLIFTLLGEGGYAAVVAITIIRHLRTTRTELPVTPPTMIHSRPGS